MRALSVIEGIISNYYTAERGGEVSIYSYNWRDLCAVRATYNSNPSHCMVFLFLVARATASAAIRVDIN